MSAAPRRLTILGATGSVGSSTADIVRQCPERFSVVALSAWQNVDALAALAIEMRAELAVVGRDDLYFELVDRLAGTGIEAAAGRQAVIDAAARPSEMVVAAIVGAAGLEPTLAAVRRGALIGLANKECLVSAGSVMIREVERYGARLLPIDSEHNAIFQALADNDPADLDRLLLTASGGPFRGWSSARMSDVTPAQAVAHPNWSMGAKISIDSATMMNKGLEIIEACHLFGVEESRVEVVVHPQSIIHSAVTLKDGSTLAQLSPPDMRVPIAHVLAWPKRLAWPAKRLDLAQLASLTFERPDPSRFPALSLARQALRTGGAAPTVLNAANEVAVQAFLNHEIGFLDIARIAGEVMNAIGGSNVTNLQDVLQYDAQARRMAERACADNAVALNASG